MSAIRLARGFTGRDVVVKFAGCYHGHVDALLASAGSGVATFGLPDTRRGAAVERRPRRSCCPTTTSPRVEAAFAERGSEIAVRHHRGRGRQHGRRPAGCRLQRGPARGSRAAHGALLISRRGDDRLPGAALRLVRPRGPVCRGAPDLFTFGKVMGGGFPAAAFGGRADVMAQLAPAGPVYQAGTLSGNPVATAAGLATLRGCTPRASTPASTSSARAIAGAVASALSAGPRCPHHGAAGRDDVLGLLPRTARSRLRRRHATQDTVALRRLLPRDARAGRATCRRPRSRPGSSRRSHDDEAVDHVLAALPAAARAAATPD